MDEMLKDERFAHIPKDPRFRRIPKSERKVKIDKRFRSMFTDKRFNVKYTIDKRGRPINQTSHENYKKFYDYSSSEQESDSSDSADTSKQTEQDKGKKQKVKKSKDKAVKQEKKLESKKKGKSKKDAEEDEDPESKESDESDENSEEDFSSNGKLLLAKQSKGSDRDFDVESDQDSGAESDENSDEESEQDSNGEDELVKNKMQSTLKIKSSKKLDEAVKQKLRDLNIDYARGEGVLFSDSSSGDDYSENEVDEDEEIEHAWGELDKDAESTEEITYRLAACNMDWDRIRAVDIMVLFNSFLPSSGYIKSVTIYPSEFGLQRMKEEDLKGPAELVESKDESSDEDILNNKEETEEGSQYHREKLRKYQLNRLKYYYAVIVFDSAATANKIYEELDGREYESSSTKLDLRFIPDEETFDQEPKEVCDKLPDLTKYTPRLFTTTALQQVKVELTWDETNPERKEFAQKAKSGNIDEIDKSDLQAYLASGTSEEESEDEVKKQLDKVDKTDNKKERLELYKSLVKSIEEADEKKKNRDVELEFTWGVGVKEKTEKLVKEKEKQKQQENLTPFEKYLEKRKEKIKAKRQERKKLAEGDKSDSEDSIPSDIDMNDPYFAEEMKNMPKQKSKKQKDTSSDSDAASENEDEEEEEEDEEKKQEAELELLLMDENEENHKHHFDMKRIEEAEALTKSKKKRLNKRKKDLKDEASKDDFQVNVKDPRFEALYNSHLYNIDPTDPHYRKTKGTQAIIQEKLKRKNETESNSSTTKRAAEETPTIEKKKPKITTEISSLVNSIKRKTKNINKSVK